MDASATVAPSRVAAAAAAPSGICFAAGSSGAAAAALAEEDAGAFPPPPSRADAATATNQGPPPKAAAAAAAAAAIAAAAAAAATAAAGDDGSWQPKRHPPFIIGVAGGTASGKTTVCERIMRRLNDKSIVLLSQDSFYRPLSAEQAAAARRNAFNFDHPDAFDTALLVACLRSLSEGRAFDCPVYDFAAHARARETRRIEPVDVVVLEGILVLAVPAVRDACSLRVYVDTDDDVRLARRIQRDVAVRGRDVAGVIAQYQRFVKPCFDTFVAPSRRHADVIVPWHDGGGSGGDGGGGAGGLDGEGATADEGGARFLSGGGGSGGGDGGWPGPPPAAAAVALGDDPNGHGGDDDRGDDTDDDRGGDNGGGNVVAIDLIEQHIRSKLQQHPLRRLFPMLSIIQPSFQLVGMLTILRDASTPKEKFVFFADRVIRLVVEAGLGHLPFAEKTVRTPTGHRYVGVDFCRGICGVSVIRSGEAMETALRACCHGVKIGKLLVARTRHNCGNNGGNGPSGGGVGGCVGRIDELASPSPAPSPAPGARPVSSSSAVAAAGGGASPRPPSAAARPASRDGAPPPSPPSGRPLSAHGTGGGKSNGNGNGTGGGGGGGGGNGGGGSLVIYEKLPRDIASRHVLLMDPVLTTGHTATKAVETLLARGVSEERVIFLSILASPAGVARLCGAHPRLRLVTAEIDEGVDAHAWQLVPGMGEFGQRYYS